jgi:hypothetical protein
MSVVSTVAGGRLYIIDSEAPAPVNAVKLASFAEAAARRPTDAVQPPSFVAPSQCRPGLPPRVARPLAFTIGPRPGSPLPDAGEVTVMQGPRSSIFLNPERYLTKPGG